MDDLFLYPERKDVEIERFGNNLTSTVTTGRRLSRVGKTLGPALAWHCLQWGTVCKAEGSASGSDRPGFKSELQLQVAQRNRSRGLKFLPA